MSEEKQPGPAAPPATTQEKLVGGVGIITLGELEITITPLSQKEENVLDRRLRIEAEKEASDHYTRCQHILKAAESVPLDRLEMLREIPKMANRKEPLGGNAVWEYRNSPAGVALELFTRGKKATPGLELKALQAIITAVNVDDVIVQMLEIIEAGDPKATH